MSKYSSLWSSDTLFPVACGSAGLMLSLYVFPGLQPTLSVIFPPLQAPCCPSCPKLCPHNTSSFPCLAPWMHAGDFLCGLFWQKLSEASWSFNGWVISDSVMLFLLLPEPNTQFLFPLNPSSLCNWYNCALLKLHMLLFRRLEFFFSHNTAMCLSSLRPNIDIFLTPLFWWKNIINLRRGGSEGAQWSVLRSRNTGDVGLSPGGVRNDIRRKNNCLLCEFTPCGNAWRGEQLMKKTKAEISETKGIYHGTVTQFKYIQ